MPEFLRFWIRPSDFRLFGGEADVEYSRFDISLDPEPDIQPDSKRQAVATAGP
jgi:hypothetical protein